MLLLVRIQQWEEEVAKTESRFAQLLSNLHEQVRGELISFELVSYRQHVYFYLSIPDRLHELVVGQIYALYHDCVIEEQYADYATPETVKGGTLVMTELKTKRSDLYPIKRFTEFEGDSLAGLFTVMSKAGEGQRCGCRS